MSSSALDAPPLKLLIGVISYPSPLALVRRNKQRTLCNASHADVVLRFVLGAPDTDAHQGDVLMFNVTRNDRALGTYLLTNRFFRYAITQPDVAFVARADDDTVFNAGTIRHLLIVSATMPWVASGYQGPDGPTIDTKHVVFGPYGEWYMWNPEIMVPSCFAYYNFRWAKAKQAADQRLSNESAAPLARWQRECVTPGIIGPFPYAKGPFVAYSRHVAAAIVPYFAADEQRALARDLRPLKDHYGVLRKPSSRQHPSKTIVYDDVYYSALVFEAFRSRSLTLVRAPFSEYVKERIERLQPALIYHKLKHPMRFEYVRNHSARLSAQEGWGTPQCGGRPGWARGLKEHRLDCCDQWVGCEWKSFFKWKDIPKRKGKSRHS